MVSVFSTVDAFKKRQFPLNLGIINSYRTISAKQEIFMKSSQILRYMLQGTSELWSFSAWWQVLVRPLAFRCHLQIWDSIQRFFQYLAFFTIFQGRSPDQSTHFHVWRPQSICLKKSLLIFLFFFLWQEGFVNKLSKLSYLSWPYPFDGFEDCMGVGNKQANILKFGCFTLCEDERSSPGPCQGLGELLFHGRTVGYIDQALQSC